MKAFFTILAKAIKAAPAPKPKLDLTKGERVITPEGVGVIESIQAGIFTGEPVIIVNVQGNEFAHYREDLKPVCLIRPVFGAEEHQTVEIVRNENHR